MKLIFWTAFIFIFYTYFGYLLLLKFISFFYANVKHNDFLSFAFPIYSTQGFNPPIALIISMSNETVEQIKEKVNNTKEIIYGRNLNIFIALDNHDRLEEIQQLVPLNWKVVSKWFVVNKYPCPVGKEAMQKYTVDYIIEHYPLIRYFIFTDTASLLNSYSIKEIVKHFADPDIGMIDGRSFIDSDVGEGLYLKYENTIRELETDVNSLTSGGGCLFAVCKDVVTKLFDKETQSDFSSALVAKKIGKRAIFEPLAFASFSDTKNFSKEYYRKYRTVLRGMNTFFSYKELLNPFNYPFFSLQLLSHKLFKWIVPFMMIMLFVSNIFIIEPIYQVILLFHFLFYILFIIGMYQVNNDNEIKNKYIRNIVFFVLSNIAICHAWVDYVRGKKIIMWKSTER